MAVTAKRKWQELDLLCRTGAGLAAIAPIACRILRELVGADAAALFWIDRSGLPEGFFHEDSPAEARDLFVNEFERLFLGPAEINVAALAKPSVKPGGRLLAPPSEYFRSNTFNLLVRASGHHHALDLRIDHEGRARAIVLLFRAVGRRAFTEADLASLNSTAGPLTWALDDATAEEEWEPASRKGLVLVDASGSRLLMINDSADEILRSVNTVGQDIQITGPIHTPPRFIRRVCAELAQGGAPRAILPMPSGRLVVTPERLRTPQGDDGAILVSMQAETPRSLRVFEQLMAYDLSPKQRGIMMSAALGHDRSETAARTRTSEEAMKKHLGSIYEATGARSWDAMTRLLRS